MYFGGMVEQTFDESSVPAIASALLQFARGLHIFLFEGEPGSGKTTMIKAMCNAIGVQEPTSSPTFALINTYSATAGPVYHLDLYRIRSTEELADIGFSEYLHSGHPVFIEWPAPAYPFLAGLPVIRVHMTNPGPDQRTISYEMQEEFSL